LEYNSIDGETQGVMRGWYKDGTLKFEHNYEDGKKHGAQKDWEGTPRYCYLSYILKPTL